MSLLADLRRLFADAEVSLVGGRDERVLAERALAEGDFFRARSAARRLLDLAPNSPIGLALLADACEGAGLDAELEQTLAFLAKKAGASPDVWIRLGRVRQRVGASSREVREAYTRAVAWDDDPDVEARFAARAARLALADLELAEGSPARADGWLARLDDAAPGGAPFQDVTRRRLASALQRRSREDVTRLLPLFSPEVGDAEGQRLAGEAATLIGDDAAAARSLSRAAILGDERSVDALREVVARSAGLDPATLRAVETVARARDLENRPLWRAALLSARGDAKAAAIALRDALEKGVKLETTADRAAARGLAVAARDERLLALCLASVRETPEPVDVMLTFDGALADGATGVHAESVAELEPALDALLEGANASVDPARLAWAGELTRALAGRLLPRDEPASWDLLTGRLASHARSLGDLDAIRRLEHLASERARPLRVAIVGEFNAGKSTFVNALLGMDVAPTGILPTTAVAHTLRFGPDPIARARLLRGGARTVPPERLKALLGELGEGTVDGVDVEVPFPYLQRVELVDTPGFNAPDPTHAKVAMDTLIEGAGVDLAIWLFDAGQALKTSERRVIEAIVKRGIPIQALLNKADRMSGPDLAKVMSVFAEDSKSIGLSSFRPPLAFSARRAVEARIAGDEQKLLESGFVPVRALLEDELPAHGPVLKERALRRRAHDVATLLAQGGQRALDAAMVRRDDDRALRARMLAQATLLERAISLDVDRARSTQLPATARDDARADEGRRAVRDELRAAIDAFRRERDELLAKDEPSMAPYLERRLGEHVETSAARAMASALSATGAPAGDGSLPLDELWTFAAALGRGFSAGGVAAVDVPRAGDLEGGLVRALLGVLSQRLRSRATREVTAVDGAPARARELSALLAALAGEQC